MLMNLISYIIAGTGMTVAVTLVALPMGLMIGLSLAIVYVYGGKLFSPIW